ncbi:MAG TPA: GNAT family N-acetyltransferase [Aestuariivirga sp.]|nr:GNAT family N-acetyltransferase [Aestuariivirga sp.]
MNHISLIKATPWDTAALGMPTWELTEYSEAALQKSSESKGHYTLRIDPLTNKRLVREYGFYYCDTLIEPFCTAAQLSMAHHPDAAISKSIDKAQALDICQGAFSHGRFHRDFNLPKPSADQRYNNWLAQLLETKCVYGLYWDGSMAGFIGYSGNKLVLHAVAKDYRGKGLSKYWWRAVCSELLQNGHDEIASSVSATNLAAVKLYASLGFNFRNPQDVYHRLVQ